MNHYEFLEVSESASIEEILAAYEKLKNQNPNPSNLKWAANLQNARDTLTDEWLKKEYDRTLTEEKAAKSSAQSMSSSGDVSVKNSGDQGGEGVNPSTSNRQSNSVSETVKAAKSTSEPLLKSIQRSNDRERSQGFEHSASKGQSDSSAIDSIERKGLFKLTRFIAIGLIGLLCLSLLGGLMMIISNSMSGVKTEVSAAEVLSSLSPSDGGDQGSAFDPSEYSQFAGLDIPKELHPELRPTADNERDRAVIWGWINTLSETQQQEYLNELAEAVRLARESGIDRRSAINEYNDLKQRKLKAYESRRAEERQKIFYGLTTTASSLVLIALFSLILVLLAIERNTRVKLDE